MSNAKHKSSVITTGIISVLAEMVAAFLVGVEKMTRLLVGRLRWGTDVSGIRAEIFSADQCGWYFEAWSADIRSVKGNGSFLAWLLPYSL